MKALSASAMAQTLTAAEGALSPFLPAFRRDMVNDWYRLNLTQSKGESYLQEQQRIASRAPASDDDLDTLKSRAVLYAAKCKQLAPEPFYLPQRVVDYVQAKGETLPKVAKNTVRHDGTTGVKAQREGIRLRLTSERWWLRRLRNQQARAQELQAIRLGLVNAQRQAYVSDWGLMRVLAAQEKALEWLDSMDLLDVDTGEILPLRQAAAAGVSNPVNRRNEMMLRIADGERFFSLQGYVALFLTLTAPSKYHKFTRAGTHRTTDRMGVKHSRGGKIVPNPNYCESINGKPNTPKLAHDWLSVSWARFRAAIQRRGMKTPYLRVTEPHHDGVTHWHGILFVQPTHLQAITALLWHYWLREDADEAGARKHRVQIVKLNPNKGRAAGYIAKYVAKNIQGLGITGDDTRDHESGLDSSDAATRVHAWRTRWGVRAFQFSQTFGRVGLWRELRRLKAHSQTDAPLLDTARFAADTGDYYGFLKLLNDHASAFDFVTTDNPTPNSYGEITQRLRGIAHPHGETLTRDHTWTLHHRPRVDTPLAAATAWSSVNNCTGAPTLMQEVQP